MKKTTIKVCPKCEFKTTAQSKQKCPRCKVKLISWDPNKAPLGRQPEWPTKEKKNMENAKSNERIDYTKYYKKNNDK